MIFFSCNLSNVNALKCVSMTNKECKVRPKIIVVNSDEPSFYPYSVEMGKYSDSCNACSRVNVSCVLISSRAKMSCLLKHSRAPTCLPCLRTHNT